jgi:hypothetical protein
MQGFAHLKRERVARGSDASKHTHYDLDGRGSGPELGFGFAAGTGADDAEPATGSAGNGSKAGGDDYANYYTDASCCGHHNDLGGRSAPGSHAGSKACPAKGACTPAESRPGAGKCVPLDRSPRHRERSDGAGSVVCTTAARAGGEVDERSATGAASVQQNTATDAGGASHPGLAGRSTAALCAGDSAACGVAGRAGHPGSTRTGADDAEADTAAGSLIAAESTAAGAAATESAEFAAAVGAASCGETRRIARGSYLQQRKSE